VDKIERKKSGKRGNVGSGTSEEAGSVHGWRVGVAAGTGPEAARPLVSVEDRIAAASRGRS
jgi:hypothetical protein